VRKVYKASVLIVALIALAGCAPVPAFAASSAEPAAPIPGGLSWWQLAWIVAAILVFAVVVLVATRLCDASDRAAGLIDGTGVIDEPPSNVHLLPGATTAEVRQYLFGRLEASGAIARLEERLPPVTINAEQVHVARSVPGARDTSVPPLALTVTDEQGNTMLVTFRDPHVAVAAGVALRIEGTIAAAHTTAPPKTIATYRNAWDH